MFPHNLPPAARELVETYDASTGCYRKPNGERENCYSELEVLSIWHNIAKSIRAKTIVETGTYYGLSTCFLAAALHGTDGGRVLTIDPMVAPHLWDDSDLAPYIDWVAKTSGDAYEEIRAVAPIDMLCIDGNHTYAYSSWELLNFEPLVREGGYIVFHDSLGCDGVGRTIRPLYLDSRFEAMTFETRRTAEPLNRVSCGCTVARKICHGPPIVQDTEWLSWPEATVTGPLAYIRQVALDRAR